jgi:hypothetical protein
VTEKFLENSTEFIQSPKNVTVHGSETCSSYSLQLQFGWQKHELVFDFEPLTP